jgi:hypothetical protein
VFAASRPIGSLSSGYSRRYPSENSKLVLVDFVVVDIEVDTTTPLILRRSFLSTVNANIDVGAGEINLSINGKEEKFAFKPRVGKCSMVRILYVRGNMQKIEVTPPKPKKDVVVITMKKHQENEQHRQATRTPKKKSNGTPKTTEKLGAQQKPSEPKKTIKVWRKKEIASSVSPSPGLDDVKSS